MKQKKVQSTESNNQQSTEEDADILSLFKTENDVFSDFNWIIE